ncbi:MAG: 23S rRNA (guanosine(2251)-2'-O)-methyltransferase RlmB [Candidatus Sericytochromatia bacterium]|uniref:23S rRNA (Guanosine(2251)-2'-O)-methyltransferase RlmB n=1 Tax=Candidatus Tanganyikabacteria bacterium TaxID=2961651 RepID=A0A937X4F9_9BACT|nr:23S rRNA (guanosine(2251)-2'-O)-methyltransferase RlmB [Candidatus Tanganyikabacteria bacterium]
MGAGREDDQLAAQREQTEESGEPESEIVWGRHAVLEALQGERDVNKVWILRGLEDQGLAGRIRRMAREKNAIVQEVERAKLNALAPASHQGVVASLSAASYADFDALIEEARGAQLPLLLILDGLEDPHNLGALIRTAGAAGAQGVVIPRRRAVGLTGTVAKAAAGALEHVPVARTTNLAQALDALKKAGFWVVGAHQDAQKLAYDVDLTGPLAIVVGAEGPGLSRLTLEKCDLLVKFPISGAVPSLNASVAGGLLLFEVVRQRAATS